MAASTTGRGATCSGAANAAGSRAGWSITTGPGAVSASPAMGRSLACRSWPSASTATGTPITAIATGTTTAIAGATTGRRRARQATQSRGHRNLRRDRPIARLDSRLPRMRRCVPLRSSSVHRRIHRSSRGHRSSIHRSSKGPRSIHRSSKGPRSIHRSSKGRPSSIHRSSKGRPSSIRRSSKGRRRIHRSSKGHRSSNVHHSSNGRRTAARLPGRTSPSPTRRHVRAEAGGQAGLRSGRTPAPRWCRRSRSCWTSPCPASPRGWHAGSGSLRSADPACRYAPSRP